MPKVGSEVWKWIVGVLVGLLMLFVGNIVGESGASDALAAHEQLLGHPGIMAIQRANHEAQMDRLNDILSRLDRIENKLDK